MKPILVFTLDQNLSETMFKKRVDELRASLKEQSPDVLEEYHVLFVRGTDVKVIGAERTLTPYPVYTYPTTTIPQPIDYKWPPVTTPVWPYTGPYCGTSSISINDDGSLKMSTSGDVSFTGGKLA